MNGEMPALSWHYCFIPVPKMETQLVKNSINYLKRHSKKPSRVWPTTSKLGLPSSMLRACNCIYNLIYYKAIDLIDLTI